MMDEIMTATEVQKINAKYVEKLKQDFEEIQRKAQQEMDALGGRLYAEMVAEISGVVPTADSADLLNPDFSDDALKAMEGKSYGVKHSVAEIKELVDDIVTLEIHKNKSTQALKFLV